MKYITEIADDGAFLLVLGISTEQERNGDTEAENKQPAQVWRTADERPEDDSLAIVITTTDAKYFATPHNGRWDKNVKYWMPLPAAPDEK